MAMRLLKSSGLDSYKLKERIVWHAESTSLYMPPFRLSNISFGKNVFSNVVCCNDD